MDVVEWVLVAAAYAWVAVCFLGVAGVVLGLVAHFVAMVEEAVGPAIERRREDRARRERLAG